MGLTWFIKTIGGVTFYRHGGSTHGQNGQLLFVPGQDFAFAMLSNAESGDGLGMEMFPAALELFLGVVEPPAVTYSLPASELAEYAGRYDAQAQAIELTPQAGGFSVQIRNKGGFPTPETPASPDPQPFPAAFYAADHIRRPAAQRKARGPNSCAGRREKSSGCGSAGGSTSKLS